MNDLPESFYAQLGAAVPSVRELVTVPDSVLVAPGALVDAAWLAARIDDTTECWACPDSRTAATLWWYSASSVILAPFCAALLVTGAATDPDPTALDLWLRPNGYLLASRARRQLAPGVRPAGRALETGLGETVKVLSDLGGASPRALWAIAADSLASWMLSAGRDLQQSGLGCRAAVAVAEHSASLPTPRYIDLPTRHGDERFVRRNSCCLLYQAPGYSKCQSCPRRLPADRRTAMGA